MLSLYLLKLSISIAIVYLFYQLLLRRLTFYAWNRLYLFGYCLLSFAIPFINISPLTQQQHFDNTQLIRFIPVIENFTAASPAHAIVQHAVAEDHSINGWQIFYAILITGSVVMLIRLITQLISLQKIKKNATIIHDEEAVIYNVDKKITPFSFGNAIYINQEMHSEKELQEIILHEYVHVKQKHTADIILSELICVINWYNPFAWLMRHAIRQNLEFIADNKVLQHGTDKKSYQYHLIKVVGSPQYRIANNFNFSSLKKRIAMMNKIKSAKLHLLRFLFVLPLLAVLLLAFRNKYADIFKKKFSICNIQGVVIDAQTDKPLADVKIRETISGSQTTTNKDGFYSLQINIDKDSLKLKFDLKKNGYEDGAYGYNYAGNYSGFINVLGMFDTAIQHSHTVGMFMPGGKTLNTDPTADDVSKLFKEITATNDSENEFLKFLNSHPDLTFYSTEGNKEHIVISKDGSVERYGYAGGATIEDMDRKYPSLPQMMRSSEPDKHSYYHEQWRKISQQAEKVFKTDNPNVKEIIFPGDSRIIVILKDGSKPKFYDMDNAVPEERPAFEKLYGSLDGIVPPAANFANGAHNDARYKDWRISGIEFIGFNKTDFDKDNSLTHFIGQGILKINNAAKALIIYNNKEYDPSSFKQQFGNTKFRDVFIYENEGAFNKFGEKGKHGVIVINDNSSASRLMAPVISVSKKDTVPSNNHDLTFLFKANNEDKKDKVLFVVDGKELGYGEVSDSSLSKINPADIESVEVLKDEIAVDRYGERGKNGVIIITMKKTNEKIKDTVINKSPQNISFSGNAVIDNWQSLISVTPYMYKDHFNGELTFVADTIFFANNILKVIGGTITMKDKDQTVLMIKGSILVDGKTTRPLIIYNGEEINKIKNFKIINGNYKLVSLNQKEASNKYGEKGNKGALEISTL